MNGQLTLTLFDAPVWVSAFDQPRQPPCACRFCRCREDAEGPQGVCALCYYGVHLWACDPTKGASDD